MLWLLCLNVAKSRGSPTHMRIKITTMIRRTGWERDGAGRGSATNSGKGKRTTHCSRRVSKTSWGKEDQEDGVREWVSTQISCQRFGMYVSAMSRGGVLRAKQGELMGVRCSTVPRSSPLETAMQSPALLFSDPAVPRWRQVQRCKRPQRMS